MNWGDLCRMVMDQLEMCQLEMEDVDIFYIDVHHYPDPKKLNITIDFSGGAKPLLIIHGG